MRLRDANREINRLRGTVVIQHSKREQAEVVLKGLMAWLSKLFGLLKGECWCTTASVFLSFICAEAFAFCSEVLASRTREEGEAVLLELSRLDDPAVQGENTLWMDRGRARVFVVIRLRVNRVAKALG